MKSIMKISKNEYKQIILRSPSIGGLKNEFQLVLILAALAAAFYKKTKDKMTLEQAGQIFNESIENTKAFKIFCGMYKKTFFTNKYQSKASKNAIKSQEKRYREDWVFQFEKGSTIDEFFMTYTECGICKLLKRESVIEIGPYICKLDYIMAKYMNAHLERTKTLNNGDDLCDFHYSKIKNNE